MFITYRCTLCSCMYAPTSFSKGRITSLLNSFKKLPSSHAARDNNITWLKSVTNVLSTKIPCDCSTFSLPEAALLLVSTKNHEVWEGPIFCACPEKLFLILSLAEIEQAQTDRKVSYPRTLHIVPSQGSNKDGSIWHWADTICKVKAKN